MLFINITASLILYVFIFVFPQTAQLFQNYNSALYALRFLLYSSIMCSSLSVIQSEYTYASFIRVGTENQIRTSLDNLVILAVESLSNDFLLEFFGKLLQTNK